MASSKIGEDFAINLLTNNIRKSRWKNQSFLVSCGVASLWTLHLLHRRPILHLFLSTILDVLSARQITQAAMGLVVGEQGHGVGLGKLLASHIFLLPVILHDKDLYLPYFLHKELAILILMRTLALEDLMRTVNDFL